jgi:hypothetical protein
VEREREKESYIYLYIQKEMLFSVDTHDQGKINGCTLIQNDDIFVGFTMRETRSMKEHPGNVDECNQCCPQL